MVAAILVITAVTLTLVGVLLIWGYVRVNRLERHANEMDRRHARLDAEAYVETMRSKRSASVAGTDHSMGRRRR